MDPTQRARIDKLQRVIDNWAHTPGDAFIDHEREQELAPVKNKAMALINHRARSTSELTERLRRAEFREDLVEEVVARCTRMGLLNDREFAYLWVEQRSVNQKKSAAVLRRELQAKGVATDIIDDALRTLDDEQQQSIMQQVIEKKAATITTPPDNRAEYDKYLRRIIGVAARRGFPQGQVISEARRALDNRIAALSS